MATHRIDKWTAFLASLAAPGAGQLLCGSAWCLPWFLGAGALAVLSRMAAAWGTAGFACSWLALAIVGLASAEHAQRLASLPRRPKQRGTRSRVRCFPPRGRSVKLRLELDIQRPAAEVWSKVADLPAFLCIDPFHTRVVFLEAPPAAGLQPKPGLHLALEHEAFGIRFWRFGRLLHWREGCGYAFSDLSARGNGRGFPHVFFVSVAAAGAAASRVRVEVRGKWTSRWIPVRWGAWWLRYVVHDHARLLRRAL